MKKDTSKMLEQLQSCGEFTRFYRENVDAMLGNTTLSDYLASLLQTQGIRKADAIRRSELSEIYAYQIFSGVRVPERKKLLSLAVGMGLTLEQLQNLLKCAGYAPLYVKNTFDCIVIYGICKKLTVSAINELLFDYGQETLG